MVRENDKPAIRLYEKNGFVIEGLHRNAVCIRKACLPLRLCRS